MSQRAGKLVKCIVHCIVLIHNRRSFKAGTFSWTLKVWSWELRTLLYIGTVCIVYLWFIECAIVFYAILFETVNSFSTVDLTKNIAPALWGNPPLFDLAENLTQCREYYWEQLSNWSKVGRSLGLTCGGQKVSLPLCANGMRVRETLHEGPSLSLVSLTQERSSLIWLLQVKPIDLPTFDQS